MVILILFVELALERIIKYLNDQEMKIVLRYVIISILNIEKHQ